MSCCSRNGCGDIDYRKLWYYIHLNSIGASPHKYNNTLKMISNNLPGLCGDGMRRYMKLKPYTIDIEPYFWTWEFHNYVNKMLGKRIFGYFETKKIYLRGI